MPRGTIKFFNESRGYGFITSDGAPGEEKREELFVHHSQIAEKGYRTLKEGDEVTFEVREGKRGPEAVNVQRVS